MNTDKLNQKEYLKRYLSGDKNESKKSKKKKHKTVKNSTITIVDDDFDLSQLANTTEADLDNYNLGEDLPQIAGIIDERPADLIAKEDYKTSTKWKSIGDDEISSHEKIPNRSPDASPRRRSNRSPDASPQRRSKRSPDVSPKRSSHRSPDASLRRRSNRSPDASPRRRSKRSPDVSPKRRSHRSPDVSPRRRSKRSPDVSPPRRPVQSKRPHRHEISTSRNYSDKRKAVERVSDSPPPTHSKMAKTLDGKIAGLQDAKALREENELHRKRENEMFEKLQQREKFADNGGVVRDRKTGRHRRLHEQDDMDREKLKKEEERKQVYDRWGKGLKQIENYKEQVASEMHEMSKPMARYANDVDLEDYLRSQCRDGDPMAAYFRKKSNDLRSGPSKPIYQGSFPENRFNIRPGYRWDGVDRSNGYEKKWFDVLNQKKAGEEEAYKYSVEDM